MASKSGQTYFFTIRAATDLVGERNGRVIDQNYGIKRFTVPSEQEVSFDGIAQVEIPSRLYRLLRSYSQI